MRLHVRPSPYATFAICDLCRNPCAVVRWDYVKCGKPADMLFVSVWVVARPAEDESVPGPRPRSENKASVLVFSVPSHAGYMCGKRTVFAFAVQSPPSGIFEPSPESRRK